jgi:hypothetical protein
MLTTSLQKPQMFGVVMPDKTDDRIIEPASRTMTICLGKNNQVLSYLGLAESPVNLKITDDGKDGIRKAIVDIKNRVESSTGHPMLVIIKASDHSVYANLVNVLDEVNIAGGNPTYAITDIQPKDIDMLKQRNAY